jgi:transcriptional regulator with GAF, ATPase, and Fis domain
MAEASVFGWNGFEKCFFARLLLRALCGHLIATKSAQGLKTGSEMSRKTPPDDDSKLDQAFLERPECEGCRRDLELLVAGHERVAKAMACRARNLSSQLSAFAALLDLDGTGAALEAKAVTPAIQEEILARVDVVVNVAQNSLSPAVTIDELGEDTCMVVASPAMRRLRQRAELVARETIPVLILGESGTGKEVIARFIHSRSPRSAQPFLKINCAALPAGLLESELFGYEQGAFTGASSTKPGKFEQCAGGSILLDEIGEMSSGLQAKLLQVLHDKSFARLGSRKEMKVDVRIIAATNIDLQRALADGTLREDLYYRLNGITLEVPPLREREEDIPYLLKHLGVRLAERYACRIFVPSPKLIEGCMKHSWPGNVRELINFVKRTLVLRDEDALLDELRDSRHVKLTGAPAKKPVKRIRKLAPAAKDLSDS